MVLTGPAYPHSEQRENIFPEADHEPSEPPRVSPEQVARLAAQLAAHGPAREARKRTPPRFLPETETDPRGYRTMMPLIGTTAREGAGTSALAARSASCHDRQM